MSSDTKEQQEIELINKIFSSEENQLWVESNINDIYAKIAAKDNVEAADSLFDDLERIQFFLAKAVYQHEKEAIEFLNNFITTFENIQDAGTRNTVFLAIKKHYEVA